MPDPKLGRLPDRTPVKLTINLWPDLAHALDLYAEFYRQTYGQAEPVAELAPFMLDAFLKSDRAFAKAGRPGSGDSSSPPPAPHPSRRRDAAPPPPQTQEE